MIKIANFLVVSLAASALLFTFNSCKEKDTTCHVEVVVIGNGSVTGAGDYERGSSVKLIATPDEGCMFIMWGNGSLDNPRKILSIQDNMTDTAYFGRIEGTEGDFEWVNLKLPSGTLWAKNNIGIDTSEYGALFAFGETAPKNEYTRKNYKFFKDGDERLLTKYQMPRSLCDDYGTGCWYDDNLNFIGDSQRFLSPEDNAAVVNWGGGWGMPTSIHVEELINNCTCIYVDNYKGSSTYGYIVRSKINNNEIFLPYGVYWENEIQSTVYGKSFFFSGSDERSYIYESISYRCEGHMIRPICISNANGHEYVDLGLPSGALWATCNVGAESPEEPGGYFAWGETSTKNNYEWENYKYVKSGGWNMFDINKYTIDDGDFLSYYKGATFIGDSLTTLEPIDDAATAILGSKWHIPTKEQWEELRNNCFWVYDSENHKLMAYAAKQNTHKGEMASFGTDKYSPSDPHITFEGYGPDVYSTSNTYYYVEVFWDGNHFDIRIMDEGYGHRFLGALVRPVCQSEDN